MAPRRASTSQGASEARGGKSKSSGAKKAPAGKKTTASKKTASAKGNGSVPASTFYDSAPAVEEEDVFCVCLGKDDGRPMIMCEACENWFHFDCVGLTEEQAASIAGYYCALCEQAGSGQTVYNTPAEADSHTTAPDGIPPLLPAALPPMPRPQTPSDSGDEEHRGGKGETDDEYSDSELPKKENRERRSSSSQGGKKRRRVVEDDDDMAEQRDQRRKSISKKPIPVKRGSQSQVSSVQGSSVHTNATRKHVLDQLSRVLDAIFKPAPQTGSADSEEAAQILERASELAESVEADLFEKYAEPGDKGQKMPKQKYTTRFRTLFFNLKNNEYFKERVRSVDLDAEAIVAMNQEDLLTPEARLEQEAIKAHSLAQSVKVAVAQPKTRTTHKGEEVIDQFDSGMAKDSRAEAPSEQDDASTVVEDSITERQARSRSQSAAVGLPDTSAQHDSSLPESPRPSDSPFKTTSPSQSPRIASPSKDYNFTPESKPPLHHTRSDSLSRSGNFDMNSIWDQFKAPTAPTQETPTEAPQKQEDDMEIDSDDNEAKEGDADEKELDHLHDDPDFDPFSTTGNANTDDDFDAILAGDKEEGKVTTTKSSTQEPEADATASEKVSIEDLPSVWHGAVSHPEEGEFNAKIVQVGGNDLGVHPHIWDQILPKQSISISGRIDVKSSSEYLVQCHFASSRELVVLAILPAITTTEDVSKHSHLVQYFASKKRYGVAPPTLELRKITKDHYIVPLRKVDPVPDYIELLDQHTVGDAPRSSDLLLSVLVLQKGLTGPVPSQRSSKGSKNGKRTESKEIHKASTANPAVVPTPSASPLPPHVQNPSSQSPLPPHQLPLQAQQQLLQQHANPSLPNLDPNALQSLLANPALLQTLSQQQQASIVGSPSNSPAPPNFPFPPSQQSGAPSFGYASPTPPQAQGQQGPPSHPPPPSGPASMRWQNQGPQSQFSPNPHGPPGGFYQQGPPPGAPTGPSGPHPPGWHNGGNAPWQGGPPPNPGGWQGAPTGPAAMQQHPPGYIDPMRIKAVSAAAREEGMRLEEERRRNGGRPDNRQNQSDRHRPRNSDYQRGYPTGPRSDGYRNDDRRGGNGPPGRGGGGNGRRGGSFHGGNEQSQVGQRDNGWGRR